ncbi:MAG: hypothetical protein ABJA10_00430 [Aestuariivirga sp.]
MRKDKPDRVDYLATAVLVTAIFAILLLAYVPPSTLGEHFWLDAAWPLLLAIISTFIAAFAGTWGAQITAERVASRKALLSDIRNVNAALALCFSITNTFITFKKQYVDGMVKSYDALQAEYETHKQKGLGGKFHKQVDFSELLMSYSPIDELRKIVFEKLSPSIKVLLKITPLVQSIHDFTEVLNKRNEWIVAFRNSDIGDQEKFAKLLGFEYPVGKIDERYKGYMQSLKEKGDDCIVFPILISQSLKTYGEALRKRYGDDGPKIVSADFQNSAEYVPNLDNYKEWLDT